MVDNLGIESWRPSQKTQIEFSISYSEVSTYNFETEDKNFCELIFYILLTPNQTWRWDLEN